MAHVFVPYAMRKLTGGQADLYVPAATLRELIDEMEARFPGFREQVAEGERLVPGLAAVIDGEPTLEGLRAKLDEDTEVHFLPAIAGGAAIVSESL